MIQEQETKKAIFKTYQIVWYIVGFINALLFFRFIFKMLGANRVGIVDALYGITDPLALPFYGIFGITAAGDNIFEWTTLVAIAFYLLAAYAIVKLLEILKPTSVEEVEREM